MRRPRGAAILLRMIPIFAGFWRRCAAFVIDGILLSIPNIALGYALPENTAASFFASVVIGLAYYAGMHSSRLQATVGKLAFGIKVTDATGRRIGVGRAMARYFATWLSLLALGVGFLMAAFSQRKRALHDMLCDTLVVNREAQPEDLADPGNKEVMALSWPVWAVVLVLFVLPVLGTLVAAVALPVYHEYATRSQVAEAMAQVEAIKEEVVTSLATRRTVRPGPRPLASPLVQEVDVDATGQLTITLSRERLGGGKVFMAPVLAKSSRSEWRCWAEGVALKYMPVVCRE